MLVSLARYHYFNHVEAAGLTQLFNTLNMFDKEITGFKKVKELFSRTSERGLL